MNRSELIVLGTKVKNSEGTEEELDELMKLFDKNVPYPHGSNLFFYPENYNSRKHNISSYSPTVEEVVDKCLSYEAIRL